MHLPVPITRKPIAAKSNRKEKQLSTSKIAANPEDRLPVLQKRKKKKTTQAHPTKRSLPFSSSSTQSRKMKE
jgi:hypothetical protein